MSRAACPLADRSRPPWTSPGSEQHGALTGQFRHKALGALRTPPLAAVRGATCRAVPQSYPIWGDLG